MGLGRLDGKIAIVTGAGGGIGQAVCQAFAREGASIVGADIDGDALAKTDQLVESEGGKIRTLTGDVSEPAYAIDLVQTAKTEFGGLTTVVTCAVRDVSYLPVTDLPLEEWQGSIDVNLTGVFLLLKHAIPEMIAGGGGSIILTASQLANAPKPGRAWYASQKGALISLVKCLAVDHADDHIRANTLSPGPTADERFFSQWPTEEDAHAHASTLFHRLGEPLEMANGYVFLASDESSFMTGTDLLIDGGYTAV